MKTKIRRTIVFLILLITVDVAAQDRISTSGSQFSATPATLRARRERAMQNAPDALVLVRSRSKIMAENEDGFRQDAAFYYLTGLDTAIGALLVLDSRRRESWLFVPPLGQLPRIGSLMHPPYAYVESGEASAARLGLNQIVNWDEFERFVDRRLTEDSSLVIRGPFLKDKPG